MVLSEENPAVVIQIERDGAPEQPKFRHPTDSFLSPRLTGSQALRHILPEKASACGGGLRDAPV